MVGNLESKSENNGSGVDGLYNILTNIFAGAFAISFWGFVGYSLVKGLGIENPMNGTYILGGIMGLGGALYVLSDHKDDSYGGDEVFGID